MNNKRFFKNLPTHFFHEEKSLLSIGINSWTSLKALKDEQIHQINRETMATSRNLKRLRCIALLICELDLSEGDAALLMHSGVSSIKALAALTPQELFTKTNRLERLLGTGRTPVVSLEKANLWIKRAQQKIQANY